jgi:Uncharacterized protein conserved in bacteria
VTQNGVEGDTIVSTKHHGGPDQAVYIYTAPDYSWWSKELSRDLPPGIFGENLTLSDLESAEMRIGDRITAGEVVLEVSAPRIPCMTLESRMGIRGFAKQFRDAERPGLYCRVIQEGRVRAGDAVCLSRYSGPPVTLLEVFRDFYEPATDAAEVLRILAAPVAIRARNHLEKRLANLCTASLARGTLKGDGAS